MLVTSAITAAWTLPVFFVMLWRSLVLHEPGIHGHYPAYQHHSAEQLQSGGDVVGLVYDGLWARMQPK
jgi:hypothetical protein